MMNLYVFDENTSSTDALIDFATGRLTFPKFRSSVWPREAKEQVDKLRKLGRKKALTITRGWCTRMGYDYRSCPTCGK
jgi:hypothetical protein